MFLGRYLAISQSKGARSPPKVRDTIKIILLPKTLSGPSAEIHLLLPWLWVWEERWHGERMCFHWGEGVGWAMSVMQF